MENISKKLQEEIPSFESGKEFQFKLLGTRYDKQLKRLIVPTSKNVLSEDVIYDHGKNKNVDIKCISRRVPMGQGVNGSDVVLEKIFFDRHDNGRKVLYGKDKGRSHLFEYLFLSNYNKANAGKPWHIKPSTGYIYEFLMPEKTAEERLAHKKEVLKAQQIAMDLTDDEVSIVAEALSKNTSAKGFHYSPNREINQLRDGILNFASRNPAKMLNFDKEFNLASRKLIDAADKAGLINIDTNKKQVSWADTGNKICVIESGRDAKSSLVAFFTTKEGKQVLKTIIANLEEEKVS